MRKFGGVRAGGATLADKIAVVTGGSTGIGRAIGERFVAEGARVFIAGRRQAELDTAVNEIGSNVEGIRTDSADVADLHALYRTIQQRKARLDVLVANAGGAVVGALAEVTEEVFDQTFGTNVKGVLFTVQKALPLLAKDASVILTGSATSLRPAPGLGVYSATKAAVRNLARSWIIELGASGVGRAVRTGPASSRARVGGRTAPGLRHPRLGAAPDHVMLASCAVGRVAVRRARRSSASPRRCSTAARAPADAGVLEPLTPLVRFGSG